MKTVGIIAEYNPFHKGHAYQLRKAKELSGADFAVVVMSGDFVQRGGPALTDHRQCGDFRPGCGECAGSVIFCGCALLWK